MRRLGGLFYLLFFYIALVTNDLRADNTPANNQNQVGKKGKVRVIRAPRDRVIDHNRAYEKRNIVGGHVNIKVTPPRKTRKNR